MDFYDLDLDDKLLDAIDAMQFSQCTPIQEQSIPPLLEGKDLVGIAQTGTGKTAAYLLPILNRLCTEDFDKDAINCLIMVPTRELAQQIDQTLEAFSYFLPVSGVAIYGGNDGIRYEQERKSLQLGADIVVATPGRLLSHLSLGNVDLSRTSMFVLDEADRMLDMGFIEDIEKIASFLPKQRQTLLFSATMPAEIQKLANHLLNNPVSIEIAIAKPAEKIDQSAVYCSDDQKMGVLLDIFKDENLKRVIIFCSKKRKVHELCISMMRKHLNVAEMHSDLEQKQREEVLRAFKTGKLDILISTDLLSRGIDIDDIEMVINYDVPRNTDDYVHRIGRTARANRYGKAITLVNKADQNYFRRIEAAIEKNVRRQPLPEGMKPSPATGTTDEKKEHRMHSSHRRPPRKDGEKTEGRSGKPRRRGRHSHRRKKTDAPATQ